MRTRALIVIAAAALALTGCGDHHLVLKVDVLSYLDPALRAVAFGPVPGVPIPVPARRRWLAIVGSAGQPRDGSAAACYALLDQERSTLTFHRVPYDWSEAARKITAAGLPERLALRLARGE